MSLTTLKKELQKLDKDKLIELVADLYQKNKSVKEFFDFYVQPDDQVLFSKYRDKVYESFFPKRGFGYKLKEGKQAISDFRKLGPAPVLLADLMLVYVETGIQFTSQYGDINEAFYSSLESTYAAALKQLKKIDLLSNFALRAEEIVRSTSDMGWGFHDTLSDIYAEHYDRR